MFARSVSCYWKVRPSMAGFERWDCGLMDLIVNEYSAKGSIFSLSNMGRDNARSSLRDQPGKVVGNSRPGWQSYARHVLCCSANVGIVANVVDLFLKDFVSCVAQEIANRSGTVDIVSS